MPSFRLFCNNENTYWRVYKLLENLPPFFDIPYKRIETPDVTVGMETDPLWAGFPFPVNRGDVYIFDHNIAGYALGGGGDMRASIRVRDEDTDEVIFLRIWHELLHAVGQPADDMSILASEWQTPTERIIWYLCKLFNMPVDIPYWQRKYYTWLTARAEGMV